MDLTSKLILGVSAIFAAWVIWGLWRFGKMGTLDIRMLISTFMVIIGLILGGKLLLSLFSN